MRRRIVFIVSKLCRIPDPGSVELFWRRLRLFISVLTGKDGKDEIDEMGRVKRTYAGIIFDRPRGLSESREARYSALGGRGTRL